MRWGTTQELLRTAGVDDYIVGLADGWRGSWSVPGASIRWQATWLNHQTSAGHLGCMVVCSQAQGMHLAAAPVNRISSGPAGCHGLAQLSRRDWQGAPASSGALGVCSPGAGGVEARPRGCTRCPVASASGGLLLPGGRGQGQGQVPAVCAGCMHCCVPLAAHRLWC